MPNDHIGLLNDRQRESVCHTGGPLLVAAGAGTGKTRVITHRIARLVDAGASPDRVLALTFTNRAAAEMQARVIELVGNHGDRVNIGTFHWLGHRLLRRYGACLSVGAGFRLLSPSQSLRVLRQVVRVCEPGTLRSLREIRDAIAAHRNGRVPVGGSPEETMLLVAAYVSEMRRQRSLDLDDLILESVALLERESHIRARLQSHFEHILVDEYQDTNLPQLALLYLLVRESGNITAVGDDDQAIYGWRFAATNTMIEFSNRFPGTTTIRLEENYRSVQRILSPANELLLHNPERIAKTLRSTVGAGRKPTIFAAGDDAEEAQFVTDKVRWLLARNVKAADIAILQRINAQSRAVEDAFVRAAIPYEIRAGRRFYERPAVARLIDAFRVVADRSDTPAWIRLLQHVDGVGPVLAERYAGKLSLAAKQAFGGQSGSRASHRTVQDLASGLSSATERYDFDGQLQQVAQVVEATLGKVGVTLDDQQDADANVAEFLGIASQVAGESGDITRFLDHLALMQTPAASKEQGGVQVMTIHGAKGLEFEVVFVTGVEEGLLPHRRAGQDDQGLEEERRLLYVAMTRARTHLYLSYARSRPESGSHAFATPSRFLDEMPRHMFTIAYSAHESPRDRLATVAVGELVHHPRWGSGEITAVTGAGRNTMVTICFTSGDSWTVQLRHAPLKRIS